MATAQELITKKQYQAGITARRQSLEARLPSRKRDWDYSRAELTERLKEGEGGKWKLNEFGSDADFCTKCGKDWSKDDYEKIHL